MNSDEGRISVIKAVLFDMDGTIFDSEKIYRKAWLAVFQKLGIERYYEESMRVVTGRDHDEIGAYLRRLAGYDFDYEAIWRYKSDVIFKIVEQAGLELKPGVPEVFDRLHEMGILCALASSTNSERAEQFLTITGVKGYFDLILTGKCVAHSKPAPDVFLLAAEKLGVAPNECLVAEDSENGVLAGYAAGMKVVFVKDLMDLTPKAGACVWRAPATLESLPELVRSFTNE